MRARLAVAVSGCRCELREVALRDKPQEMLAASPKGTVPVLIDPDGRVIDESLDIMLWALQRHDPEHWLTPQRGDKQAMLQLIARFDAGFKYHLDRYKYPDRYPNPAGARTGAIAHRDAAATYLAELDARLTSDGWMFGGRPALADMAIFPLVRQFAHTDGSWFAEQPWPALQRWLAAVVGPQRHELIMKKYPVWKSGDAAVAFPAP